jgi:5-methylcytosine-specific restriction protein A
VIRDFRWDTLKPMSRRRIEIGRKCTVPGCCNDLTAYLGPGSDTMCRDHQINLVGYGGTGYQGRDHTHHRKWKCDWCTYDPREDPRFDVITDPKVKLAAMRACLIADHKERKADGGSDEEGNIQTLCNVCNNIKTMMGGDTNPTKRKNGP